MAEIKERNQIEDKFKWNLKTMYASDEAWEQDLLTVNDFAAIGASYAGTLNTVENILAFVSWEAAAMRKLHNLYCYASLRQSEDSRDSKAGSMVARAMGKFVQTMSACAYSTPELLALPQAKLDEIINDERLAEYKFMLEDIVRSKPHTLSAKEEILLSSLSEALGASDEAATMLMDADLVFEDVVDGNGNVLPLSNATYIPYQMSDDRVLREKSFNTYYKSYKQYVHTLAATYGGAIKKATTKAMLRGYSSSREMRLADDNIPVSVYDNLLNTVHNKMDLMYRYVALRKKILGVDTLHYYDVYASLSTGSAKKYSYEEAKEMVAEAVKPLGDEYVTRVRQAYEDGWIDVYPNKGKTGGAYSSGTYDSNPFILMNYTESLDSVSTLAHEMGHSQHSWLTHKHQPSHYANYSMFVAEVASTVNENLLIDQLLANCTDPKERMALLNQYLEGFKGTVYRQAMFAEFEMKAHGLKEAGKSLDADTLSDLYYGILKEYFGPEMVIDEPAKYEWARIPHFYNPFYVYVYATGFCAATALSEAILHDGQEAVDKYLEFLSMGGSAYPLDELKHAGVDLTTPEPLERALSKFEAILEDAEKTYALLSK